MFREARMKVRGGRGKEVALNFPHHPSLCHPPILLSFSSISLCLFQKVLYGNMSAGR